MTTVAPSRANTSAIDCPIPRLQVGTEFIAKIVAAQRELDGGLQEAQLVAGIIARAFEHIPINRPVAQKVLESVGQLNFAAASGLDRFDGLENFGGQHIAADNSKVGGSLGRLGLLHQVANPEQAILAGAVGHRLGVDRAIGGDRVAGHFHQRDDRGAVELIDIQQLAHGRDFGINHIVREHHRKGLAADQIARPQDRVAQAECFLLAHISDVDHVGDIAHDLEQIFLALRFERLLQLETDVEMILDGGLASSGHDDYVLNTGMDRLFDAILD
jgi:hypothetical protein